MFGKYRTRNLIIYYTLRQIINKNKSNKVQECLVKCVGTLQLHEYKPIDDISVDILLSDKILQLKSSAITTLFYIKLSRDISVVIGVISIRRLGLYTAQIKILSSVLNNSTNRYSLSLSFGDYR